MIVVFSLSVLRWRRIRGLWKLPDGRHWLRGKLRLLLMGGALLSKIFKPPSKGPMCLLLQSGHPNRLQQHVNCKLPDVQTGFRKGRGSNCQYPLDHWKGKRVLEKYLFLLYWLCQKSLSVWITKNCVKFFKRWEYQTTWPASWKIYMQGQETTVRTGHGKTDWFQIRKEYVKAVYCHPAFLIYMQSTSWEMPDWMKLKLESRFPREISITSDTQMTLH